MEKFTGIYTALVTPFKENGKINKEVLGRLIEKNIKDGVDGFYVSGSTGESLLLSMTERKYLLEAVSEAVAGRKKIIVNVGMFATEHSVELAKHAEKMNVSAISSVPPFYFPFSEEEYIQYYNDLAACTNLPVIVYNIPAMSSVRFSTESIAKFFENDKIIGLKHTSYDLFQLQQIIKKYPERSLFVGHDELYLSALAVGAVAGIGSTYNIMADKFIKMNELFKKHDMEGALKVQNEVNEVISVLCKVGVFKGVKEILKMQGLDCGICRKPFLPLEENAIRELRKIAEKNNIL